jgi:hypothetical protein
LTPVVPRPSFLVGYSKALGIAVDVENGSNVDLRLSAISSRPDVASTSLPRLTRNRFGEIS